MALTRDFKQTIVERVQRDPEFVKALLDEAATLFLNGEAETAAGTARSRQYDCGLRGACGRDGKTCEEPSPDAFEWWQSYDG